MSETKFYDYLPIIQHAYPNLADERIRREFLVFTAHTILRSISDLNTIGARLNPEEVGLGKKDVDILFEKTQQILDHGVVLPIVFDYLADRSFKTHWLEKTPTHIFHVDKIACCVPTAQFVEIVRDPRSILASKKVRRETVWTDRYTLEERPFKHLEKAYDPLWDTLSWKSAIHAGRLAHYHHPEKILTVRYEDLVTRQEIILLEICKFLAIKFEAEMLDVRTKNTAYWAEKDFTGISSKFTNSWRTVLVPSEVNFPQILARKEMQALDYALIYTLLSSKLVSVGYLFRSALEFMVRSYRRYKLGGGRYLLNVFRNYLHRSVQLFKRSP